MALNYNKLAVQRVFEFNVFSLEDGTLKARLEDLKDSSWTNNGQVVYAQGGAGNPKLIGFSHSRESSLSATSATISDGSWALQAGPNSAETLTNTDRIMYEEVVTASGENTATISFKAKGTANEEIGHVYLVDQYGATKKVLTQAATAESTGKFSYTSSGNTLTFYAGDVKEGDRLLVFYYPNVKEAKVIGYDASKSSENVKVVGNTIFLDTCTGKQYAGQLVYYKAKVGEETTFDLTADGDPAVQNITFEALQSCESTKFWDIFIYDPEDIADAE